MSALGNIGRLLPPKLLWSLRRFRASRGRHISQIGQDFWVIGEVFNEKRHGFFVDVGSADGFDISNTLLLETRYQWSGICVEANPDTFAKLRACRRAICVEACVDNSVGTVKFQKNELFSGIVNRNDPDVTGEMGDVVNMRTVTLVELLDAHQAPREIDYLSIDVEGAEERVLLGFDFGKYIFRCMTIERPSERLRQALVDNGYVLVRDMPGLDAFFVHSSFVAEYATNAMAFWAKRF